MRPNALRLWLFGTNCNISVAYTHLVNYSSFTAEGQIKGKSSVSYNDVAAYTTYGISRATVSYTHLLCFFFCPK